VLGRVTDVEVERRPGKPGNVLQDGGHPRAPDPAVVHVAQSVDGPRPVGHVGSLAERPGGSTQQGGYLQIEGAAHARRCGGVPEDVLSPSISSVVRSIE
jgi:hypothetical protein